MDQIKKAATALRATRRGTVAFLIIVAVFATADPTLTSLGIGGVMATLGELLRLVTAGYGYKIGELSINGPYRFVRHPYFLGTVLIYFGLCVAGRDPYVMAAALLAMTFAFRADVRFDEARLARHLGPRFSEYRARVPAFIPQLVPVPGRPEDNQMFSLEYALLKGHHRELDALLGLAAAFALLYGSRFIPAKDLFHLGIVITGMLYVTGRGVYFGVLRRARRSVVS